VKNKRSIFLAFFLLAMAGGAQALSTDGLIAITEMPLAVAEVAALPEVPQSELFTVVTTLNQAAVPAPQFVEVVRYVPVALVQTSEPRFVSYVTDEYGRGVVGDALAVSIANRYQTTYGLREVNVVNPPVIAYTTERQLLPDVVVTRFQPVEFDPLALVAMPLAVAAVSNLTDVPQGDLIQFITALNQAFVPAPQFVEVVRYSPVLLVDQTERPQFIRFVTTEIDRGVIGRPLSYAIVDRYRTAGVNDIDLSPRTRVVVDRDVVLPPIVVTRVASGHPHGGPPGQLKKERGLRTGAEIVHHTQPRTTARRTQVVERPAKVKVRTAPATRVVIHEPKHQAAPVAKAPKPEKHENRGQSANPGRGNDHGNAGGGSHGGGKGKKGKG
jgi:hypothetical protein